MSFPAPDRDLAIEYARGERDPGPLLAEARRLRDERGRTVTYSRKVFIPITNVWLLVVALFVVQEWLWWAK